MAYSINSKDYFSTLLYSGNSTARSLTGVGFAPSFVWIKERTSTSDHMLFDQPRGVQKYISSNLTNVEQTSAGMLTAFGSDGFSLGSGNDTNDNGQTYIAWNWIGNGQGSSNTDGSINTTYTSANTTAGISIIKYTGTGSNATIGHGLGVAPKMVMVKQLSNTRDWSIYHKFTNPDGTGAQYYMHLNNSDARASNSAFWNNTDPTNQVVNLGSLSNTNQSSGTYIAYCFADVQGFSKIGLYTGNGNADGTFVYTGFKPAFVLVKETGTGNWIIKDNKRPIYNQNDTYLFANTADAESSASVLGMDLLSNGFKLRGTAGDMNGSATEIIYMAFADEPLVSTNGVPATAR